MWVTVVLIVLAFLLTLFISIRRTRKKSQKIVSSIEGLAQKAQQFGQGDFTLVPIDTAIS